MQPWHLPAPFFGEHIPLLPTPPVKALRFGNILPSLVAQLVKNLTTVQETWVQSLGLEDPRKKGKATHSQYSGLENSIDSIVHRSQTIGQGFNQASLIAQLVKNPPARQETRV